MTRADDGRIYIPWEQQIPELSPAKVRRTALLAADYALSCGTTDDPKALLAALLDALGIGGSDD